MKEAKDMTRAEALARIAELKKGETAEAKEFMARLFKGWPGDPVATAEWNGYFEKGYGPLNDSEKAERAAADEKSKQDGPSIEAQAESEYRFAELSSNPEFMNILRDGGHPSHKFARKTWEAVLANYRPGQKDGGVFEWSKGTPAQ